MPTLDWLTRREDEQTAGRVPYRLLEPVAELSSGDPAAENMLIHGDNLDALKALLPFYAGRVKCIYIDPPYNTRSAFAHYDDNLEHSQWLAMIYPRLELLRDLLAEDGSIWVSIDDNEGHYLKVVMDEVFGRGNFVATNVWQKRYSRRKSAKAIGDVHEYHLCLCAETLKASNERETLCRSDRKARRRYTRIPDNDCPRTVGKAVHHDWPGLSSKLRCIRLSHPGGVVWPPSKDVAGSHDESEYKKLIWLGSDVLREERQLDVPT